MTIATIHKYTPTIRELRIRRGAAASLLSDLKHFMEWKDLSSEAKQINFAEEHKGLVNYHVPDIAFQINALQTKGTGAEVLLIHDMPVSEDREGERQMGKLPKGRLGPMSRSVVWTFALSFPNLRINQLETD